MPVGSADPDRDAPRCAELALHSFNGRMMYGQEVRVNWAAQREQKVDTTAHFHIFVGDLAAEVNDRMLQEAFSVLPGCSDARVVWDHTTGRCVAPAATRHSFLVDIGACMSPVTLAAPVMRRELHQLIKLCILLMLSCLRCPERILQLGSCACDSCSMF